MFQSLPSTITLTDNSDTPVKPRPHLQRKYGMPASRIRKEVVDELQGNVRVASPEDFLNGIFHTQADLDAVFTLLRRQGLYDSETCQWNDFPGPDQRESKFYGPIVNIANTVNKICAPGPEDSVNGVWLDTHSVAPKSRNADRAAIEPDIVYVSQEAATKQLQEKLWIDMKENPRKLTEKGVRIIASLCQPQQLMFHL